MYNLTVGDIINDLSRLRDLANDLAIKLIQGKKETLADCRLTESEMTLVRLAMLHRLEERFDIFRDAYIFRGLDPVEVINSLELTIESFEIRGR